MTPAMSGRRSALVLIAGGVSIWLLMMFGSQADSPIPQTADDSSPTRSGASSHGRQAPNRDPRDRAREPITNRAGVAREATMAVHEGAPGSGVATSTPPPLTSKWHKNAVGHRAPRIVGKPLPPEIVHLGGRNLDPDHPQIDGCGYAPLSEAVAKNVASMSEYVALVDVDYDHDHTEAIQGLNGEPETDPFTPIDFREAEVFVNRMGASPDQIYLAGTCDEHGLCKLHRCENYGSSGLNLVFADRYCGPTSSYRRVLIINAVYPVDAGMIYSFDGSSQPLRPLLKSALPEPATRFETQDCPRD